MSKEEKQPDQQCTSAEMKACTKCKCEDRQRWKSPEDRQRWKSPEDRVNNAEEKNTEENKAEEKTPCAHCRVRRKAVINAWKREVELIRLGYATREWSETEQLHILLIGDKSDYAGHHMKSVKEHAEYAGCWKNIEFLDAKEHIETAHAGNTRNSSNHCSSGGEKGADFGDGPPQHRNRRANRPPDTDFPENEDFKYVELQNTITSDTILKIEQTRKQINRIIAKVFNNKNLRKKILGSAAPGGTLKRFFLETLMQQLDHASGDGKPRDGKTTTGADIALVSIEVMVESVKQAFQKSAAQEENKKIAELKEAIEKLKKAIKKLNVEKSETAQAEIDRKNDDIKKLEDEKAKAEKAKEKAIGLATEHINEAWLKTVLGSTYDKSETDTKKTTKRENKDLTKSEQLKAAEKAKAEKEAVKESYEKAPCNPKRELKS